MFKEIGVNFSSIIQRKLVCSVGVNDANYNVTLTVEGKLYKCPYYQRWYNMVSRCYDKKHLERYPTYKECSVCESWLTFSNFKRWMVKQRWKGLELDKDIITLGNKIYSPDNCAFVPQSLNSLIIDHKPSRGKYPLGVCFHKQDKKYQAQLNYKKKKIYLGQYSTAKEASLAYIKGKIKVILEAIEDQRDSRVVSGLRDYIEYLKINHKILKNNV